MQALLLSSDRPNSVSAEYSITVAELTIRLTIFGGKTDTLFTKFGCFFFKHFMKKIFQKITNLTKKFIGLIPSKTGDKRFFVLSAAPEVFGPRSHLVAHTVVYAMGSSHVQSRIMLWGLKDFLWQ